MASECLLGGRSHLPCNRRHPRHCDCSPARRRYAAHAGHPATAALSVANTVLGAVDLDIYGAFQLCTIGILTAPATVRLSNTYFNNPGRNVLFIWTMLVLAGT